MDFRHGLVPSNKQAWNSGGTAHVLPEELSRATFDIEKMTNVSSLKVRWGQNGEVVRHPNDGVMLSFVANDSHVCNSY